MFIYVYFCVILYTCYLFGCYLENMVRLSAYFLKGAVVISPVLPVTSCFTLVRLYLCVDLLLQVCKFVQCMKSIKLFIIAMYMYIFYYVSVTSP